MPILLVLKIRQFSRCWPTVLGVAASQTYQSLDSYTTDSRITSQGWDRGLKQNGLNSRNVTKRSHLTDPRSSRSICWLKLLSQSPRHSSFVRKQAEKLFTTAVDRNLFAISKEDMIQVAGNLYPLHPTSIATICSAVKRFGQNERSLFSFLLSLEPASLKRFFHETRYAVANWYTTTSVFDYLAATIGNTPGGDQADRWSLALDALAATNNLTGDHQGVLKTVALIAVLEPIPGIIADTSMIAWSLGMSCKRVQRILADLAELNVIYRRPYRGDYSLWSRSSVDLSRWLDEAKVEVRVPARLKDISNLLTSRRPVVAHRHYHATGTLRTFEVALWTGENIQSSEADGMVLIVPGLSRSGLP